ncbi:MAG: hypothetical protein U0231_16495 [Nitrospiraceae bacterium]
MARTRTGDGHDDAKAALGLADDLLVDHAAHGDVSVDRAGAG